MRTQSSWQEYFYFKKHERRGLLIVSILMGLTLVLPLFYPLFYSQETVDFSEFKKAIIAFEAHDGAVAVNMRDASQNIELFTFNPNQATSTDFEKLGLSTRTIRSIINYRNKGGKFYKKEDFKRIYTLAEVDYLRLLPYIDIPQKKKYPQKKYNKPSEYQQENAVIVQEFNFDPNTINYEDLRRLGMSDRFAKSLIKYRNAGAIFRKKSDLKRVYNFSEADYLRLEKFIDLPEVIAVNKVQKIDYPPKEKAIQSSIDINTATSEEWQTLHGIGPGYSKKILNYREKLGGFADINQVGETYYFPDSVFQKIKPFLKIETPPQKLFINKISFEELKAHPLFSYKEAKRILAYRHVHGDFSDMKAVRKMPAFKEEFFVKIEPYLSFE